MLAPLAVFLIPAVLAAQSAPSNLVFRGTPGEAPAGWLVPPVHKALGYWAEYRRDGCWSSAGCAVLLPPAALPPDGFGNLTQSLDATPYRGKTVRLRSFLKVDSPASADHAQMWLRVDLPSQQMGFYDDMGDRPVTSSQWRLYEITGEVAPNAETIHLGVMAYGKSPVWIDGVSFEIMPEATTGSEVIAVRRAIQKLYERIDAAYTQKDIDAVASLALRDAEVRIGARRIALDSALLQIMVEIEKGAAYASRSTVTDLRLSGANAIVSVNNEAVRTVNGSTEILISANRDTWVKVEDGWKLKESALISSRSVTPPTDAKTAAAVTAELKQRAVPLRTAEPGGPRDDLAAFGKAVGDARMVALGDATHGTREFFQLKHRLFEYLVSEKGFTVLALEANWPESLALDRYVKTGEGSAKAALAGMYGWTWATGEMESLIEWMRSYNQAPGEHPQLSVTSFDMQTARVAARMAADYLTRFAPDAAAPAEEAYTSVQMLETRRTQIYDAEARALADRAAAVVKLFDQKRGDLVAASSADQWRDARQAAVIVYQSCAMRVPGKGPAYRDASMAGNVDWLRQAYAGQKMVLWALNSHVSFGVAPDNAKSMGAQLRALHGKQIYVVGFAFRRGQVRAVATANGRTLPLDDYEVPPSPDGSGDAILSSAGAPMFFLDMASLPANSDAARWLSGPHLFHDVSGNWVVGSAEANLLPGALSRQYDGLIFVDEGHATRAIGN